ncbi:hypothetical protein ACJMK2_021141 [Sinanodonta woodiana]|uniref:WW domain-containing protein n=1 Tax=Sinanodonta woodiana TaxID=1069815 RepID=A0ABD3U305_SINWO
MSRKRRQVLQLDEPGKESFLARYGYHRQEEAEASPDIRDQDQSQPVEPPEHDGSCVYDAQTPPLPSSPAPRRNPDIDDKLANFLAEIDAMETDPSQSSKEENQHTNGTTVDKGWMLGSGDTNSIPVPVSSAPSKPSYSMFVKGGSEVLGSSGKVADSKKKDKEENIELPKEPVTPWQQCLDEGTQYYYYWNTKTNEVTWEIPTEYTQYLLRKKEYTEHMEKLQKEGKLKKDDHKKESNGTSVSQDPVSQEAEKKVKTPKDPNSAEKGLKSIPEPSSKSKRVSSGTSDSSSDSEASNKASSLVPYDLHRSVTSTSGSTKQNKQEKRRRSGSSDNNSSDKSAEGTKVRLGSELSDTVESTKNDDKRDKTDDDSKEKDEEELDIDIDDIDRELEMALERKREELLKLETEEKKSSKSNDKDKDKDKKDKKHKKKDKEDKHHKDDKKKEDRRRRKDDRKDDDRSSKDDKKRDEKRHKHSSDKKDRKEKEKEKEKELPLKKSLIETMREAVEEKKELELKRKRAIEELMAKELERTIESKQHSRKRHHREDSAESRKRYHRDEVEERRVRDDYDDEWNRVYKDGREVDWDRVPPLGPHTAPPPTAEMLAYKDEKKHVVDYGHSQGEPDKKVGPADSTELELKKLEALQLAELALSKLEFLEVTKKGLSKLQILLIELETRHQDWQAGGLTTQHFLAKLREANWQLEQYEESAAPPLWSCHWDRAYRRYFYVHKLTSVTQWEYPDPDDPTAIDGTHERTSEKDRMETDLVSSTKMGSRGISSAYTKHGLDRGSRKQGTSELLAGVALLPPPPPPPPEEHPSVKSLMLHYGSGSSSSQEEDEDDEEEEERKKEERKKKAFRSEIPAVKEEDVEAAMKEILEGPLQLQEGTQLGIQEILPVAYGKTASSSSASDIPPVFGPQRPPPDYQEIGLISDPQELSEGNGGAENVSRDEQDSIYSHEFSTTELSTSVPMDIDSEVSQSNEDIIGEGHQDPGEGQLKPAIISRAPVIQGPQLCDNQSAPFYGAIINSETPVDGGARHMDSAEEKERKKKKKDKEKDKEKVIAPGGISLKKRQVSSLVMKWQKVKKEVEEEERHRMEREAEIRKKLEEWKDQT